MVFDKLLGLGMKDLRYLLGNGFKISAMDSTLFVKSLDNKIFLVWIYVDNIIFGSTNESLCQDFSKYMHREFEMSMMGPLKYFLGL